MQPLGDKVLVKTEIPSDTTQNGIIIQSTGKELIMRGTVLSVGKEVKEVKEGDKILFSPYDWEKIGQGEEIVLMSELDIWAKIVE